jgi:cell shape-determining protein MreC
VECKNGLSLTNFIYLNDAEEEEDATKHKSTPRFKTQDDKIQALEAENKALKEKTEVMRRRTDVK